MKISTLIASLLTSLTLTTGVYAGSQDSNEKSNPSSNELLMYQQEQNWDFLQSLSSGTSSIDLWLNELLSEQKKEQSKDGSLAEESRNKLKNVPHTTNDVG